VGPTVLFDKSFLQSLTVDESVVFDRFFIAVMCPLFYIETLADLEKKTHNERTPEDEVKFIARKTPEMSGVPCPHHLDLCRGNLMGTSIPMDGRVPMLGGRPVKVAGRRGIVFEERPEAEAFRRWQLGEFFEIERRIAKGWRESLNSIDLLTIAAGMKALGVNPQTCRSLTDARRLALECVSSNNSFSDRLKLFLITLGLPLEAEPYIAEQWKASGLPSLAEYAPFAAHVVSVELFFQIALAANLIGTERSSNRVDIAYLSYLPLCTIFVSSDKLHRRTAEHFLRPDQSFVWGYDLKADLSALVARYMALPEEEREKGIIKFAHLPLEDEQCLVSKLRDHHSKLLRKQETEVRARAFSSPKPPPR
jgi:hypothetical protein